MSAFLALHATTATETIVFHDSVLAALRELRQRLARNYTAAYPALTELIDIVLAEEEARAWQLSVFPHLLFPDLVEAHIEKLNLRRPFAAEFTARDFAFA